MRRRYIGGSISFFTDDLMKRVREFFFARESPPNLMSHTHRAATVTRSRTLANMTIGHRLATLFEVYVWTNLSSESTAPLVELWNRMISDFCSGAPASITPMSCIELKTRVLVLFAPVIYEGCRGTIGKRKVFLQLKWHRQESFIGSHCATIFQTSFSQS